MGLTRQKDLRKSALLCRNSYDVGFSSRSYENMWRVILLKFARETGLHLPPTRPLITLSQIGVGLGPVKKLNFQKNGIQFLFACYLIYSIIKGMNLNYAYVKDPLFPLRGDWTRGNESFRSRLFKACSCLIELCFIALQSAIVLTNLSFPISRESSCKKIYIAKVAAVINSHGTFNNSALKIDPDPVKLVVACLGIWLSFSTESKYLI